MVTHSSGFKDLAKLDCSLASHPEVDKSPGLEDKISQSVNIALKNLISDYEKFEKEYGCTFNAFTSLLTQKILNSCRGGGSNFVGGYHHKGEPKKKWKYVVQLGHNRQITELLVGQWQSKGQSSSAYCTVDQVILISRKKEQNAASQMQNAFENTCFLHKLIGRLEESNKEVQELLKDFGFIGSFSEIKAKLTLFLPPKPKMWFVDTRALTIAPLAKPVNTICKNAPKTKDEIVERIKILKEIAVMVAFYHFLGFIHSDLKPENMLVYDGMARIHDVGGAFIVPQNISVEEIGAKVKKIATSDDYSHYQDRRAYNYFIKEEENDSAEKIIKVLRARDVFSLGISIIEALNGLDHLDGRMNEPLQPQAYVQVKQKKAINRDGKTFIQVQDKTVINGHSSMRKPINCIKEIIKDMSVHEMLQRLLDRALESDFKDRCSAKELAVGLIDICNKLGC